MNACRLPFFSCARFARRRRTVLTVCCVVALGLAASGCNVIGVVADKVGASIPVEPAHTPDKLVPLVVLAENYRDPTNSGSDAYRIQQRVTTRLTEEQVAPIIPADRAFLMRDRDPMAYQKLSVTQIARKLDAGQVIYIDLLGVSVGTQLGSDAVKGVASANVKLIDATTGAVLYPQDQDAGVLIGYESPLRRIADGVSADSVRAETIVGLCDRIARLFHKYVPSNLEKLDDGR